MLWIMALIWLSFMLSSQLVCKRFKRYRDRKILASEEKRRRREFKRLYRAA